LPSITPGTTHVDLVGLHGADDYRIWEHARDKHFVLMTKDDDFRNLSLLRGAPPKVVWLNTGNSSTEQSAAALAERKPEIERFLSASDEALLVLQASRPRLPT
jgi:predicted nuclease of predicted toxin-antitoxin system